MQKLPGIGSGSRLVDIDVGNNGSANEQGVLAWIVSLKLNPNRQPLYHFDEIAGGVLGRQQRQSRSGPHGKAGDPPVEYLPASVHVDIQIDRLADAQITQLRLLEIGIDPDLLERSDRHQILPGLHIVARIDISARHDTVNLGDDVAVTKVEFGLNEIAVGGFELRLRLLDGRCIRRQSGKRAVDIALIQLLELLDHLLRLLFIRMGHAQLRRGLNQGRLRLPDGGESLIEIGRHLAEISACRAAPAIPRRHGPDGHPTWPGQHPPAQPTGRLAADRTPPG